jgi:AraC family transcriptional regulator
MRPQQLAMLTATSPVHPRDVIPHCITRSSRHLSWPGITVGHGQAVAMEIDAPPFTMHVVSVALNASPRLVQRRDGRHVDGPRMQWGVQIMPAEHPSYWRAEGPIENVLMALEPRFLHHAALEACGMDPARVELRHVFGARDAVIKHLGLALLAEITTAGLGGPLYAASLANVLAIHLLRTYCTRSPVLRNHTGGLSRHKLQLALTYIADHLDQPLLLADLAALVQMAPYHFLRAFRQSTGLPPHQYVLARRLERAQALLKNPTISITTIAFRVGFRTLSHFTQHFRRQTGVTPTVYRRTVQ